MISENKNQNTKAHIKLFNDGYTQRAQILFEDGSVEDKWAYEAHNHQVPAAVAAALSRVRGFRGTLLLSRLCSMRL